MINLERLTAKLDSDLAQANDMEIQQQKADRLPGIYRGYVGKTIQEFIDTATNKPPAEQLQLYEELALMRMLVVDVLRTYEEAQRKNNIVAIGVAGSLLREAIKYVQDVAKSAAQIEATLKDNRLTPANFLYVVNQITNIAYEMLGNDPERAQEFADRIKSQTKLLVRDSTIEPTDLMPTTDDIVNEMDLTIPKAPMRVVQ